MICLSCDLSSVPFGPQATSPNAEYGEAVAREQPNKHGPMPHEAIINDTKLRPSATQRHDRRHMKGHATINLLPQIL
jgi:hypothetical protein